MPISTTKPVTVPPTTTPVVFDKVWFKNISIQADELFDPAKANEPRAVVTYQLYNVDLNKFAPGNPEMLVIKNLFTLSTTRQKVAAAMAALYEALTEELTLQGKI